MPIKTWMIYGATGYSGRLITEKALEKGLKPVLAGRESGHIWERAEDLGLECRAFSLDHSTEILAHQLEDIDALISCAGPFSATAKSMIEGFAFGTKARRKGKIVSIPLEVTDIDYGKGLQQSMSVS